MPVRLTDWVDTRLGMTIVSGSFQTQTLMGAVSNIESRRYTSTRTLVSLDMFSNTVGGAYGVQVADIAIGVISVEAFTANAAIPDPNVDNDKPAGGWLYRAQMHPFQNSAGAPVVTTLKADVRAGRKVDRGVMFIVITSASSVGTPFTLLARGLIRTLFKL